MAPHTGWSGPIAPEGDAAWLARLARSPVVAVVANAGGSSITLRVRFEDGGRALFKPEQKKWRAGFRGEIAAYHVDRLLGFGRVAVVSGRALDGKLLRAHLTYAKTDAAWLTRFDDEVVIHDGIVHGAMIAWHPRPLFSAAPPADFTEGLRSTALLRPAVAERLAEWSDMLVFDQLINNTDRWSGGNVLSLGRGGPLIFLDQAAAFNPWRPGAPLERRLAGLCRFRRATVNAIRGHRQSAPLTRALEDSLSHDPLAPVLSSKSIAGLGERLEQVAEHMDGCEQALGLVMTSFAVGDATDGGAVTSADAAAPPPPLEDAAPDRAHP